MTDPRRAGLAAAALALIALAAARGPAGLAAPPPRPSILSVRADLVADTVTITGTGFGTVEAPPVSLGGVPLSVLSSDATTIVAELPAGSAGANHRLTVGSHNRSDSADIWIPGEGIVTRNPIRIESTDSDVSILAGGSRISIASNGRIQARGVGAIEVQGDGALDLRGGTAALRGATTASVNAGTVLNLNGTTDLNVAAPTVDVTSAVGTNVLSSGVTTVTGSLVRIN
jgi:hypothetical protein